MTAKLTRRLIREGDFVAEVDVHLVEEEGAGRRTSLWRTQASSMRSGKRYALATSRAVPNSRPTSTGSRRSKRERKNTEVMDAMKRFRISVVPPLDDGATKHGALG